MDNVLTMSANNGDDNDTAEICENHHYDMSSPQFVHCCFDLGVIQGPVFERY